MNPRDEPRLTQADARRLIHRYHHLITSPRQRQVLIHIAFEGLTRRQTAQAMGLSKSTVQGHWENLKAIMIEARHLDQERNADA